MPGYFYHIVIDLSHPSRTQSEDNAHAGKLQAHHSEQLLGTERQFRKLLSPFLGASRAQIQAQERVGDTDSGTSVSLQDPRLDFVDIEGVSMAGSKQKHTVGEPAVQQNNDTSSWSEVSKGIGDDRLGGLVTKAAYIPLDKVTSTTGGDDGSIKGIVHLYRDVHPTSSLPTASIAGTPESGFLTGAAAARSHPSGWQRKQGSSSGDSKSAASDDSIMYEDCKIVCVLAVPTYLSFLDFLGFVGEQTRADVSHFRMIKTARANRYMVLMKFRSSRKAKEWQKAWNGTVFNSMEVYDHSFHFVFFVYLDTMLTLLLF